MLFPLVLALIFISILVEWAFHFIRENFEIEWPTDAGRRAIDRRARAAQMRLWTRLN